MQPKQSAWRKSRKFGDVHGGRNSPKIPDGIWNRCHSLSRPDIGQETPIYISENPSKDFFHPLSIAEIENELARLPRKNWDQITHIWQPRIKKSDYLNGEHPLAQFVTGSGVRAITLFPWPSNLMLPMGNTKPKESSLRIYNDYYLDLVKKDDKWYLQWSENKLKDFYVEVLLYHEIGHHLDLYHRTFTRANSKAVEEYANQYAYFRTSKRSFQYSI